MHLNFYVVVSPWVTWNVLLMVQLDWQTLWLKTWPEANRLGFIISFQSSVAFFGFVVQVSLGLRTDTQAFLLLLRIQLLLGWRCVSFRVHLLVCSISGTIIWECEVRGCALSTAVWYAAGGTRILQGTHISCGRWLYEYGCSGMPGVSPSLHYSSVVIH